MAKQRTFDDQMEELYGEDITKVFVAGEEPLQFIPTGAISLDVSIGGGIPKGRYTVIDGPESSGKSTIAVSICKNCIETFGEKALYIDQENQMVYDYIVQLLGDADVGKFVLAKPSTSDEAFKMIEAAIETDEFGVIVLDSIAALSPIEEQEKDFEKASVAIIPRDLAKFFRRNSFKLRTKKVAVVFVNQVRDLIGSYVKAFSNPGGHALKHYASVIVSLSKGESIKVGDDTIGTLTKFTIKKNKIAPPFRTFMIPIIFGIGVDTTRDLIEYSAMLGVLRKAGPYYKLDDVSLGKGMLDTIAYLQSDKEVLDKIQKRCYNVVSKYKQELVEDEVTDET
jgi:recombination protein RecA